MFFLIYLNQFTYILFFYVRKLNTKKLFSLMFFSYILFTPNIIELFEVWKNFSFCKSFNKFIRRGKNKIK